MQLFFRSFPTSLFCAALAVAASGCASTSAWHTGPQLSAQQLQLAHSQLQRPRQTPSRWSAEARLASFARGQRLRAKAHLLVETPDKFRMTLFAPHGPAAYVLVSDGTSLHAWRAGEATVSQAPFTRAGLQQLTDGFDLGFAPAQWLALLQHQLDVPAFATAHAAAQGTDVQWQWMQAKTQMRATSDAQGRITAVCAQSEGERGDRVVATLVPGAGPIAARMRVQADSHPVGQAASHSDFELSLHDFTADPSVPATQPFAVSP